MQAKYCVIVLLWLIATPQGECFEFAGADLKKYSKDFFHALVIHFTNTNDVGWFVCGRFTDTTDTMEYRLVCGRLADFTKENVMHYIAFLTVITNTNKDGWFVRIRGSEFADSNEEDWFMCERLADLANISADNHFVFVKPFATAEERVWFVCKLYGLHYYQCDGIGCGSN